MTVDMLTFMVLWSIILVFFMCIGMLIFIDLETFQSLKSTLIFLFQAALGSFDVTLFE